MQSDARLTDRGPENRKPDTDYDLTTNVFEEFTREPIARIVLSSCAVPRCTLSTRPRRSGSSSMRVFSVTHTPTDVEGEPVFNTPILSQGFSEARKDNRIICCAKHGPGERQLAVEGAGLEGAPFPVGPPLGPLAQQKAPADHQDTLAKDHRLPAVALAVKLQFT